MAEFLIQAKNETAALRYWRGDIVNVYPDGSLGESTPALGLIVIKVPGLDVPTAEVQRQEWWLRLGFTILSSDLPNDTFTIKVEATEFNPTSGIGKLTAGKVENYLENWGATGVTFSSNSVTYNIVILDAIKSQGFWWGLDLTGLTLVETAYTQATGVHRCRVNYTNSALTADQLKQRIDMNGGIFVSENVSNKTITFDMARSVVRDKFEADVKQRVENMIVRRKYHVTETVVDAAEAAGRIMEVSIAQYNTFWKNKLAE